MSGVRFLRIELDYGCHVDGAFEFPRTGSPVVIAGPNGAGKSTLIGAIVRTLYGFERRGDDDPNRLESRQPWTGAECRAAVVLTDTDGERWRVERRFGEAEVELRRTDGSEQPWRGDGTPGRSNAGVREYLRRLKALVGFAERDAYEATACIHQGELRATELGESLLRLAAGGHGDIDGARENVRNAFRAVTVRPIDEQERKRSKPQPLDKIESEIADLEQSLGRAETAERRRRPLLEDQEQTTDRADELRAEIERLESAQGPLAERRTLEAEREHIGDTLKGYGRVREKLAEAARAHGDAATEWTKFTDRALYPRDFPERLSALETLWDQRADRERERDAAAAEFEEAAVPGWTRPGAAAAFVIAAMGLALLLTGRNVSGVAALVLGAVGGAALVARRRTAVQTRARRLENLDAARERLDGVDAQIAEHRADVPDGDTLTRDTAPDRRDRYERQREARERFETARNALSAAVREARDAPGLSGDGNSAGGENADGALAEAARDVLERLASATEDARNAHAEKELALTKSSSERIDLPDGVDAEPAAVTAALSECRRELRQLDERGKRLDRELLETQSGIESPVALRDELELLRERRDELERDAEAHKCAYALLRDAYDEFREGDQQRLLDRISMRLGALSENALGPVAANGSLDAATVAIRGRPAALRAPPLSFGEFHAALFAVRLGATDFLAAGGVRPPLLVDEPFAHLDADRAAAVWELLRTLARDRQVIVATQDELLLERWGVTPDLVLERPAGDPRVRAAE